MNVDKVYEKKFAKYVESIKKQIVDIFSKHNFEEMYPSYDITISDMIAASTKYAEYLENQIKQALLSKNKTYIKSLTQGSSLKLISHNDSAAFVLTQRILGETLTVDKNGKVIFPADMDERFKTAGYLDDKNIFGPVLDEIVENAIYEKYVLDAIDSISDSDKFTEEEFKMGLPYVVNKIVKQMKKQVEYEVKACEEGLYSEDAPLKLEWLLMRLNDILGTHTDGFARGERDAELIEHFKNCSAAPRLKEFCDNYFKLFNDGILQNYDIYSTTAYVDTAKQYTDLFYNLDMLTIKDFDNAVKFRNVAYKMKNDDRGGGEPNPLIKEELLKKKKLK